MSQFAELERRVRKESETKYQAASDAGHYGLWRKCAAVGCPEIIPAQARVKLCPKHYQAAKYVERRAKRIQCDLSEVYKAVGVATRVIRDLNNSGLMPEEDFKFIQKKLSLCVQRAEAAKTDDLEMEAMDEAYADELIKEGAVWAANTEEAAKLIEERKSGRLLEGERAAPVEAPPVESKPVEEKPAA